MEWVYRIILFATEDFVNFVVACGIILVIGVALAIPFSTIGPFVTTKNNVQNMYYTDDSEKEINKEDKN